MYSGFTKFIILAIVAVIIYLIYKKLEDGRKREEFEKSEN